MKHGLMNGIACTGLLFFSLAGISAIAQTRADDENWYHNRESFYTGSNWKMHMFQRVQDDLNRVQQDAFKGSDEYRINQTRQTVGELQGKLTAGQYDQPQLDEAITAMEKVVTDNRLTSRDRDIMNDDLSRMRDYRAITKIGTRAFSPNIVGRDGIPRGVGNPAIRLQISDGPIANRPQIHNLPCTFGETALNTVGHAVTSRVLM